MVHAHILERTVTNAPPSESTSVADEVAQTATPELRTFLFADVRGYTRFTQEQGDAAAARLVLKFASLTREGVANRGGEVIELRGDEALAVFSSARQALRAGLDLQARYARESDADPSLPLQVGIGIDAGEAVPLEGGYRGEALNLASRLCNLAGPGEVLATEGVVYLGRRVQGVTYAERGLVPIKGFADPVRVIRVMRNDVMPSVRKGLGSSPVGQSSQEEAPLPIGGYLGALPTGVLVGRHREWEQIMGCLEAVMQGTGRLLLLSGEPGIGKTRLAQEVTLKARHWGFLIATGRCYEPEQAVPYYPFLEALATLYELSSPSIQAEVPRRWPQLGRLLPDQIGFVPTAVTDPQEDQHLLFRAVTGFIEAIAETAPISLLLDDLHWADDASLKLLQHLARYTRSHRVLLLGTYRDVEVHRHHPLESALLELSREQLLEEVMVRRLTEKATADLMAEIMGEKEDFSDIVGLVYSRTDGNAFFIQEVLRAMIEQGDLYRENGRWERRKEREIEVPKSVRSVIGQRLSRLEEQAQEILREASVLGQQFSFDDLLELSNITIGPSHGNGPDNAGWMEDEIEAALEQGEVAGLVRETGDDAYAFNHAITQQALYAELSTRRRKRIHLAAGKALERLPRAARERRAGELAWHFLEGDDPEPALRYAMLAGDRAADVFANREADRHYRTAVELARELEDRPHEIEALEKLAGILSTGARYDDALDLYEQSAKLHQAAHDREGEACAVAQMGHVYYLRDTPEEGIARLQPLIQTLEEDSHAGASYGLAALWAALARLYLDSAKPEEQLKAAERAVELVKALGQNPEGPRLLLGAEVTRSDALWRLGQEDQALQVMEELIPRAEAAGDLNNLARALGNAAVFYSRRGELDKDRLYHLRMLEVSERRGDRGQIVLAAMELSTNAFLVGQWDQARIHLERAESIIHSLGGSTRLASWPSGARAWLSLREGDLEAAAGYAQEALELAEGTGDLVWRRHANRLLAERDILEGNPTAAMERLKPFLEQPGGRKDSGLLWTFAWASLEVGQSEDAHELVAQAISRSSMQNRQPDLVEALTAGAMVATSQSNWQEAERLLNEALVLSRSMPFPFGQGRALYQYGLMHEANADRERATARLREAVEIFERLGAKKDVERTQRALVATTPPP